MATTPRFRVALVAAASTAALFAVAQAPAAQARGPSCPVMTHLHAGGPAMTFHGRLTQAHSSCAYHFEARKGEKLVWSVDGAATRQVMTDPSGNADGPGIPNPYPLNQTGKYQLDISANLMADGGFGNYTLHLRLKH